MKWLIEFYKTENGRYPVKDFIKELAENEQAKIIWQIDLLQQFGINLCSPYVEKIHGKEYKGLWELRIKSGNANFRLFYFLFYKNKFIFLHGIKKKSNKTSKSDLETALFRMNEYIKKLR